MSKEIIDARTGEVQAGNELMLTGGSSITDLKARMARMGEMIKLKQQFLKDNLTEGIHNDYAVVPGTKERSLLKPGAEKLLDWHGYYASFTLMSEKEDFDMGLFAYNYRCDIKQKGSNILVGQCEGDCSSMESKYRFEWRTLAKLPPNLNPESLLQKNFAKDGTPPWIKYQVIIDNPADKRNTVRKMAQIRALRGATVLATATSDLFTTKEPDEGPDKGNDGHEGRTTSTGSTESTESQGGDNKTDYGKPISEPQGKRLYAIRKQHKIDDGEFKAWLKAKYGWDSDKEIGWKAYEDICKACESGQLEMPKAEAKPAESTPAQPEEKAPAAAPGAKVSVTQIKAINAAIRENEKDSKEFLTFLEIFDRAYAGKGINDILAADYERVMAGWSRAVKEKAI